MSALPRSQLSGESECRCRIARDPDVQLPACPAGPEPSMTFAELWAELLPVGRDERTGGYRRYSWTEADAGCRAWFARTATKLGLRTDFDRNGNLWAWWGRPTGTSGLAISLGMYLHSHPAPRTHPCPPSLPSPFSPTL